MIINKAVILAAGKGSRMKNSSSKPMTKVGNKKLIQYGIDVLRDLGINEIYIIYSKYSEDILKLKESYPNIHFIKQENVNGSLSSFNFAGEVCKTPFWLLDCDIIFSKTNFVEMMNSIKYENSVDAYFAIVSNPMEDNLKYIKISGDKITDFDKKEFEDGYAGGMIYLWLDFPIDEAREFYKSSNSLAAFYNYIVKNKTIKPMYIERLIDIDTMEEVERAERDLATILNCDSNG